MHHNSEIQSIQSILDDAANKHLDILDFAGIVEFKTTLVRSLEDELSNIKNKKMIVDYSIPESNQYFYANSLYINVFVQPMMSMSYLSCNVRVHDEYDITYELDVFL